MSNGFDNNEKFENVTPENESIKEAAVNSDNVDEASEAAAETIFEKPNKKVNLMIPILVAAAAIVISVIIIIGVAVYNVFSRPEPDSQNLFSENLLCVKKDGKWGYVNKKGEYVIEPKYDVAYNFTECGIARIGQGNEYEIILFGYINKKGETVSKAKFSGASDFYDCGLAAVRDEDGWGIIDEKGELVVKCKYKKIEIYDSGAIIATDSKGNSYLLSKKGDSLSNGYEIIFWNKNANVGVVYEDGEIGIINEKGKEILKMTDDIDDLGGFNAAGIGCYKENNKFGIINIKGKKITDAIYDDWLFFTENGLSPFKRDGQWGIINSRGKVVLEPGDYRSIYSLDVVNYGSEPSNNGFIATGNDEKSYFFFDENGKEMFSVNEDTGWRHTDYIFSDNGLLPIRDDDGYYGYINRKGKVVIDLDYSVAHSFSDFGIARVYTFDDDQYKFINKKGKTVGEPHAYVSDCYDDGYAIALDLKDGEVVYKVVDKKGKTVCQIDCDDVLLPDGTNIMAGVTTSYLLPQSKSEKKQFLIDYTRKNLSEEKLKKYGYDSADEYVESLFKHMTDSQINDMLKVIFMGVIYFE